MKFYLALVVLVFSLNLFDSCTFEYNIDYLNAGTNNDIVTYAGITSEKQCFQSCNALAQCQYWTWVSVTQHCFLKSSEGIRTVSQGRTSGRRCNCTSVANSDNSGTDLVYYSGIQSYDACCASCTQLTECQNWTWNSITLVCALKKAGTNVPTTEANYSGSRLNAAPIVNNTICSAVLYNDNSGSELVRYNGIQSYDACCTSCTELAECQNWTWNFNTKECSLRSAGTNVQTIETKISGVRRNTTTVVSNCSVSINIYYQGGIDLISYGNVQSYNACCNLCTANSSCSFWSWQLTTQICTLKSTCGVQSTFTGSYSGLRQGSTITCAA